MYLSGFYYLSFDNFFIIIFIICLGIYKDIFVLWYISFLILELEIKWFLEEGNNMIVFIFGFKFLLNWYNIYLFL